MFFFSVSFLGTRMMDLLLLSGLAVNLAVGKCKFLDTIAPSRDFFKEAVFPPPMFVEGLACKVFNSYSLLW
jgi:hypothetical protein